MIIFKQKQYGLFESLAGREVYYHGTTKENAEKIKKEGLKPILGPRSKAAMKHSLLNPKRFEGKLYLHKDPKFAENYAREKGEVIEASVPYKVHKNYKRALNPGRLAFGASHLMTEDDISRQHLGKPYVDLNKKDRERVKSAVKYIKSEYVMDNTEIPSKYIKGSKDYQKVTPREIWEYQTRKRR